MTPEHDHGLCVRNLKAFRRSTPMCHIHEVAAAVHAPNGHSIPLVTPESDSYRRNSGASFGTMTTRHMTRVTEKILIQLLCEECFTQIYGKNDCSLLGCGKACDGDHL